MKKIKIIILILTLAGTTEVKAQGLELATVDYGLFGGQRMGEITVLRNNDDSTYVYDSRFKYFGISFGSFYSGTYLGSNELGLQLRFDMAFGKDKNETYPYGNAYQPRFLFAGGSVMGKLYFGEVEDPAFFVALGPYISYIMRDEVAPLMYGPQLEVGKQFLFGDAILALSFDFEYGLNAPSRENFDPSDSDIQSFRQYSFGLKLSYVNWL